MRRHGFLKLILVLLLGMLVLAGSSCARSGAGAGGSEGAGAAVEDAGDVSAEAEAPAAERVLRAVIEYPGAELPAGKAGGGQAEEDRDTDANEKAAWQDAVGSCFADDMFDEFYDSYDRTSFRSEARKLGLTTSITEMRAGDGNYTVTVEATDETGHTDTYETVWRVEYASPDSSLLKSIELLADGGYFCRAGCPL